MGQLSSKFGLIASSRCTLSTFLPARHSKANFHTVISDSVVVANRITRKCRGQTAGGPCFHTGSGVL